MMASAYLTRLSGYLASVQATDKNGAPIPFDEAMGRFTKYITKSAELSGAVHLIGNGGSASIVAHAHNDLMKACGIKAMVYQDVPLLTAYANDEGYEQSVAPILSKFVDRYDTVIAVSSSGMSANIVRAAVDVGYVARRIVTFTGFDPANTLRARGDLNFHVPSSDYGFVELTHAALLHYLTDELAHA